MSSNRGVRSDPPFDTGGSGPVKFDVRQQYMETPMESDPECELCVPEGVLAENPLAYVALEKTSLSRGHVVIVPRRHVADFFDMSAGEQTAVWELLAKARQAIQLQYHPDGYNIGVNIGRAAGQSRMHVHVHLIPRYVGDVAEPRGGVRCVLDGKRVA
jgi:diadenosine tetraphosphate (Ap4A) HIT family hydrolase